MTKKRTGGNKKGIPVPIESTDDKVQLQPLVYIILLNYNGYNDTAECIESLKLIDYNNYFVVVVDNSSSDGSGEKLEKKYGNFAKFIFSKENGGFAAGNNIGIKYALEKDADFVLLLNNDTIVKNDFLLNMIKKADVDAVITPTIFYYDDPTCVYYAAAKINRFKCVPENGNMEKSRYVDYASGCCMLLPKEVIKKIGLLSEEYFLYYEDMDYSIRLKKGGVRIFYEKDSIVYHKEGKATGKQSELAIYYNTRNRFYLIKKFHLGIFSYLYSYITRKIRYIQGLIKKNNLRVIKVAMKDAKRKMGKRDV